MKPWANFIFIIHVHVLTSDQQWRNTGSLQFWYDWCYSRICVNLYRSHQCRIQMYSLFQPLVTSMGFTPDSTTAVAASSSSVDPEWSQPLLLAHKRITWNWQDGFLCVTLQSRLGSSSPDCYLQGLHLSRRAADLILIWSYEGSMNDFTANTWHSALSFFGYYLTRPHQEWTNTDGSCRLCRNKLFQTRAGGLGTPNRKTVCWKMFD